MKKDSNSNETVSIILDETNLDWGAKNASYFLGFITGLSNLELSNDSIENIICSKMELEYQKDMLKMQIESNEFIARMFANSQENIRLE